MKQILCECGHSKPCHENGVCVGCDCPGYRYQKTLGRPRKRKQSWKQVNAIVGEVLDGGMRSTEER